MKLKNSEINQILMLLAQYNAKDGTMVGGLLSEKMTLGLRRRLQKIRAAILVKHEELVKDAEEIKKLPEAEQEAEFKKLFDEEVEITFEPASLEMIEAIDTNINYEMTLIEKIAQ